MPGGPLEASGEVQVRNITDRPFPVPVLRAGPSVVSSVTGGGTDTLAPGDSLRLALQWSAHPEYSGAPVGDDLAFTNWFPRFPGVGTVILRLDVPSSEIVAATGAPLCGEPGWSAARRPPGRAVRLDRDRFGDPETLLERAGLAGACDSGVAGRKVLVWYAERVPGFGLALGTMLRYEEGDIYGQPVRVFYRSGEERTWGAGLVLQRTETALAWLHEVFGDYPWPVTSAVHGSTPAGAPMLFWVDTTSQDQVLHQLGHQYTGLALAPPDSAPWLDEGLNRFQSTWFHETMGRKGAYQRLERQVLDWDLDGLPAPPAAFRMAYASTADSIAAGRSELFFHELWEIVGDDVFRRILKTYYARGVPRAVNEDEFRDVAEEVSGRELATFFRQWLHQTTLYDYRISAARRDRISHDQWRTTIEVEALAAGLFPVEVWVIAGTDTLVTHAPGRERREQLVVVTAGEPKRVIVDPLGRGHDWNVLNNQKTFGRGPLDLLFGRDRPRLSYRDGYFTRQSRRDRLTRGYAPTLWFNDAGGWTLGVRRRDDYLSRFLLNEFYVTQSLGQGGTDHLTALNASFDVRDPPSWLAPGWHERITGAWVEGRASASLTLERARRSTFSDGKDQAVGVRLDWRSVTWPAWVDRRYYDDAGTAELATYLRMADTLGPWRPRFLVTLAGGYQYANEPSLASRDEAYGRSTLAASIRGDLGRWHVGAHAYAGLAVAHGLVVRQRAIYVAGTDPYEQFRSPFLRSRGALLVRDGMYYTDPGGAGARGFDPHLAARQAYGAGMEIELDLIRRSGGIARRIALAVFADGVAADGDLDPAGLNRIFGAADAGPGLRLDHRIGNTSFQTRLDLPLWVSRPELARDRNPGAERTGWRWTFSFAPAF